MKIDLTGLSPVRSISKERGVAIRMIHFLTPPEKTVKSFKHIVSSPKQPNWQPGCFELSVRSIRTVLVSHVSMVPVPSP